jgi:hypothetical protein
MATKQGVTCGLRRILVGAYLLLIGLPVARADYIAEVKQGTHRGYLYIGRHMTKWEGSTDWAYGDFILRDDMATMYFISLSKNRDQQGGAGGPSAAEAEARLAETRKRLESGGSIVSSDASHVQAGARARYETRVVPYAAVTARRQFSNDRAMQMKSDILAHATTFEGLARVDAYLSGQPTWAKTSETAVIAGKECTKYRVVMSPIFTADVWTADLGPGYGAGSMFDKVFDLYRGGVRPLSALHDIPGFPLKITADYRDVFGLGVSQYAYEVLSLTETDLDEKEFGPKPGSRVYEGAYPGMEQE